MAAKIKRTRKLGKAQERRLHFAIRQFGRMQDDLQRMYEAYVRRPQRLIQVLGWRGDYQPLERLQIVRCHVDGDGTQVTVALPPRSRKKG
jgi:hypothetical protein